MRQVVSPRVRLRSTIRSMMSDWIVTSQAGRGLVQDQQRRRADQRRHGDHHALRHAARELVRILPGAALGFRDIHLPQRLDRARHRGRRAAAMLQPDHVGQLPADGEHRVQRRPRVLEDDADPLAPDASQARRIKREKVGTLEHDPPGAAREGGRLDAQDRKRDQRLAAAGFAHHRGHRRLAQGEADIVQHRHQPSGGRTERAGIPLDRQLVRHRRRLGSVKSDTASPSR